MSGRFFADYQARDFDIVDYQPFLVEGCDVPFRGPGLDPFTSAPGSFFSCIGAAQTYGCYAQKPYPDLLGDEIGLPALNLATGGVSPGFYLDYPALIDAMNRGRFVVFQCMSARQESNSLFAADGYIEFVRDRTTGERVTSTEAWMRVVGHGLDKAEQIVAETRRSWQENAAALIEKLTVPVIFFWFSRRGQDYVIDRPAIEEQAARHAEGLNEQHFVEGLTGDFPQFIDAATVAPIISLCDAYAQCTSSRGMGAVLINRHTGLPLGDLDFGAIGAEFAHLHETRNLYYPSEEMHQDASDALLPAVEQVLKVE
jgi:hypothetical protein